MKRKALIIYCNDTPSGELRGPYQDAVNLRTFLMSMLGGEWYESEIGFLKNPTSALVRQAVRTYLSGADYTFVVFSGHGFINTDENNRQYIELADDSIPIGSLISKAPRQTMIIDACRGYYSPTRASLSVFEGIGDIHHFEEASTRQIFDNAVLKAEKGLTIMYAASRNESALDTNKGGAYLFSLIAYANRWEKTNRKFRVLPLNTANTRATELMHQTFETIQNPVINAEKRINHFPFAVMYPLNWG